MNLKQALYVKTIAEEGGITAAAKKLYVSQPSLSQMLKLIEAELGVTLFNRSTRRVELTEYGQYFLPFAKRIVSAEDEYTEGFARMRKAAE